VTATISLFPLEAKCSIQVHSSAAGPGADVSSWEVSRASLCPTARLPPPLLLPTAPSAPRSWGSALLTAYTARCSLAKGSPKSSCVESRLGAALGITLGSCPAKAGAPTTSTRGSAKSCTWGGTTPGSSTQNHRITESQNALGWKGPLELI